MAEEPIEAVLRFWFDLEPASWFRADDALDAALRNRFGGDVEAALAGEREAWAHTPRGRLALVLLLDQLPRNLFRGTARAFAGDPQALAHATRAVEAGEDRRLAPRERHFLYLPFEHAEDLAAQQRAVALYGALIEDPEAAADAFLADGVAWAQRHLRVIERFGRFPSRNAALGRTPSDEERRFLGANPTGF